MLVEPQLLPLIGKVETTYNAELLADWDSLKKPGGSQELFPVQKRLLSRLMLNQRLLAEVGVGQGKTLPSMLAPRVLGLDSALLISRASIIRSQTKHDYESYGKHWDLPELDIRSYEYLAHQKHYDHFENTQPKMVVLDEAHRAQNPTTAFGRRLIRYLQKRPEVPVLILSGTLLSLGVKRFWFPALLGLPYDINPFPQDLTRAEQWEREPDIRPLAMQVSRLRGEDCTQDTKIEIWTKLAECCGAVVSHKRACSASIDLYVHEVENSQDCQYKMDVAQAEYDELSRKSPTKKRNSDGDLSALDVAKMALLTKIDLASYGYETVWTEAKSQALKKAEFNWARLKQAYIEEGWVTSGGELASRAEQFGDSAVQARDTLRKLRAEFQGERDVRWFCQKTLENIVRGICKVTKDKKPTLVFTPRVQLGVQLSGLLTKSTGDQVDYFRSHLMNGQKKTVMELFPRLGVVAQKAALEGANLQKYSRMIVIGATSSERDWEQLIGRMHRRGQEAETIELHVLTCNGYHRRRLRTAMKKSQQVSQTDLQLLASANHCGGDFFCSPVRPF